MYNFPPDNLLLFNDDVNSLPMAQLINLKLSRNDQSSPWGFRLQGGKDFGTPLLIQKVRKINIINYTIMLHCWLIQQCYLNDELL